MCLFVCRRKGLILLALVTLHIVFWTGIIYTIRNTQPENYRSRVHRRGYSEYFESYVNYTGPQPIPGPINLPPIFRFVLNEPETCGAERHPGMRILHYVHSAPHHFRHREIIRRTWASPKFYAQFKMATVFFLGRTENATLQKQIEEESATFKDIIQGDFPDKYYNLTYKAAFALAWITKFCNPVDYVLKTDDDVFVNAFRLTDVLFQNTTRNDDFHCFAYYDAAPYRTSASKWCVETEEYPWKKYPHFCAGLMFYYGGHLVPRLFDAMSKVPYVKIDDVYVTGMLRSYTGIGIHHLDSEVNVLEADKCLQKVDKPETSCLLDSVESIEDLWMQLMVIRLKQRARSNKSDRTRYMESLVDILNGDFRMNRTGNEGS